MGRIGAVTIILALRQLVIGEQKNSVEYSYPEERIMLS